jgi:hypothetical protein
METLIGICKKDEEKFMDMFEQLKDHFNLKPGGLQETSSILTDL